MRRAGFIVILLLTACLGLPGQAQAQAQAQAQIQAQTSQDDADLHIATRQLVAMIGDAFEVIYLLPAPLHVDWPARADRPQGQGALVFFSLEGRNGGNSYFFYVAHFEYRRLDEVARGDLKREWMNYRLTDFAQVGGKFWRTLAWDRAQATAEGVAVPTQPWLRGDAGCCPTGEGATRFDIDRHGRLTITDIPPQ